MSMAAKGINDAGAGPKLRRFLRIARKHGAVSVSDVKSVMHAVFTDIGAVESVLRDLRRARLGLSVTVTGLVAPIHRACCRSEVAEEPHTVAHSLGVWGNRRRLPSETVLSVMTMCGHSLVSVPLVEQAVASVRAGVCSPRAAAVKLAEPCVCGIFNVDRAARLIARLARSGKRR